MAMIKPEQIRKWADAFLRENKTNDQHAIAIGIRLYFKADVFAMLRCTDHLDALNGWRFHSTNISQ